MKNEVIILQSIRPSASIGVVRGCTALLALVCAVVLSCEATAQGQFVKWNIKGTVVVADDAGGYFPDVRLGDPVRGVLTYDLSTDPTFVLVPNYGLYHHRPFIDVVSMTIHNPRSGDYVELAGNVEGPWASVSVGDDFIWQSDQPEDSVYVVRSVLPPPGFTGSNPVVSVSLTGPPTTHSSKRLPSSLNLDDWPIAEIGFYDLYFEDVFGTSIIAEIYSLTPVDVQLIAGDYDSDGDVDVADYNIWRLFFGYESRYGDGNGDGVVDAADYIVWLNAMELPGDFNFDRTVDAADYVAWRKGHADFIQAGYDPWRANFGETLIAGSGAAAGWPGSGQLAVPEPSTSTLLVLALTSACLLRIRHLPRS